MTVADLSKIEARVEVDENDVVLINVGDTTKVEIDAFGDKKFIALVSQIGNSAKTTGAGSQDEVVNFEVRISLLDPDNQIRPGMSCDADIETETKYGVITVPIQSVTARMEKPEEGEKKEEKPEEGEKKEEKPKKRKKPEEVVFRVDGNQVKQIKIKTGISDDTYIEVTEGLDEGVEIVNGPYRAISKELEDGSKVMLPNKDKDKKDKDKKSDETVVDSTETETDSAK